MWITFSTSASRHHHSAGHARAHDERACHSPDDKVLEVGTGSGYQSAVLSYLTSKLWSVEIIAELAARTRGVYDRLIARGYREYAAITTGNGDGYYGWKTRHPRQDHRHLRHRPYSAAALATIADRGIMVIPIGPPGAQHILRWSRRPTPAWSGRTFWRQGHSLRAAVGRPSVEFEGGQPHPDRQGETRDAGEFSGGIQIVGGAIRR